MYNVVKFGGRRDASLGSLPFMTSFILCEVEGDNKRDRHRVSGIKERSEDFR